MAEQHCFGNTNDHNDPSWFHTPQCKERRKRGYWYMIDRHECPLCGYSKDYRERQYTPKPEAWHERIRYYQEAYHCGY